MHPVWGGSLKGERLNNLNSLANDRKQNAYNKQKLDSPYDSAYALIRREENLRFGELINVFILLHQFRKSLKKHLDEK